MRKFVLKSFLYLWDYRESGRVISLHYSQSFAYRGNLTAELLVAPRFLVWDIFVSDVSASLFKPFQKLKALTQNITFSQSYKLLKLWA